MYNLKTPSVFWRLALWYYQNEFLDLLFFSQRKESDMPTEQTIRAMTDAEYEVIYGSPIEPRAPADLFDYMVERLVSAKLATYEHADSFRKRIPSNRRFIFVPPEPTTLDLVHLMSLIEFRGKTGQNCLNAANLKNLIEVIQGPCLLLDVEDGRSRLKVNPVRSRETIAAEERIPYTTFRGIIHAFLLPVLRHHNIDILGSQCDEKGVPVLCLNHEERPTLSGYWGGSANSEWGAPSCGSILVV